MSNQMIIERARSAEMAHDFTTAARLYKELLAQDTTNVGYLTALGKIYVTAGDDKKAIPYFEQIHDFHPDNIEAMTSLGAIYRRLGRYEDSIAILMEALERGKDQQAVYYNLGFTFKEMKNYEDAVDAFENVISMNPRDVLAHNHLGSIYHETNELDKAVAAFKRGLQIDPNHPILNYNLARTYTKLRNYPDAIRSYEAALRTRPNWPEAIKNFSNLLINCQQSEEAARIVKQSIKIHPNDPELLYALGQVYLNQFDFDNAQKSFRQASEIKTNDVKILTALASAYEKADESDKALETIMSAIDVEPLNTDARMQYVDTLLSVSDYDSAFKTLESMKKADSEPDVKMMDLYGQYYITQGQNEKAEEYYEKIKKKDHHYKNYLLGASKRYVQIKKLDDAEKYAREYVKSRASRGEGYNMLGKIYAQGGRLDEAREILKKGMTVAQPNVYAAKQSDKIITLQNELAKAGEIEELPDQDLTPPADENAAAEASLSADSQDEAFDVTSFGDDVGIDQEEQPLDEMSAIENELEDDGEALIMPEEEDDYSTDQLLDAAESADSQEPENTLKPENNDNFDDILMDSFGDSERETAGAEEEMISPADDFEISAGENVQTAEEALSPSEGPVPPSADEMPPAREPEPPYQLPESPYQPPVQPAPAAVSPAASALELEVLLNATKTAQEAMRLAQEAEKRVNEVEERQKQLEEEIEAGENPAAGDLPPAVEEDFAEVEEALGMEESPDAGEESPDAGEGDADSLEDAFVPEDDIQILEDDIPAENTDPYTPPTDEELFAADEMLDEASFGGDTDSEEESDDLPMAEELSFNDDIYPEDSFISVDDVLAEDDFPAPAGDASDSDFDAAFAAEMESNLSTTLFVSVDELYSELLSKIGDVDDSDAAEKLSNLAEKIEEGEITPVEMQPEKNPVSDFKAPEEAPAIGSENAAKLSEVAEMLKKIEAILSDDDLALRYTKEICLLKHLKVLCEYLPNDEKIAFASGRIRMLIDYLLSKMSGRPGLLLTAESLLKSGILGEEYRVQLISECEDELNNEMIRRVLIYMKKLSESLEDFGLASALRACADGTLEKIEMKTRKSEIF